MNAGHCFADPGCYATEANLCACACRRCVVTRPVDAAADAETAQAGQVRQALKDVRDWIKATEERRRDAVRPSWIRDRIDDLRAEFDTWMLARESLIAAEAAAFNEPEPEPEPSTPAVPATKESA